MLDIRWRAFAAALKLGVMLLGFLSVADAAAEQRVWTSADGAFRIQAELIKLNGQAVHLRRSDNGNEIVVQLSQLSAKDREHVVREAAGPGDPAAAGDTRGKAVGDGASDASSSFSDEDFGRFSKPDHKTMLRLYYAAHGELLKENLPFGLELMTVFQLPPLQGTSGLERNGFDPEWFRLSQEYSSNEFTRKKFQDQVAAAARTQLESIDGGEEVGTFRLCWAAPLGEYDFTEQRFPLDPERFQGLNYGPDQFSPARVTVPRVLLSVKARQEFSGSMAGPVFRKNFLPSNLLPLTIIQNGRTGVFTLAVAGLDALDELPMTPDSADALLSQLTDQSRGLRASRQVVIEGLVKVGPVSIAEGKLEPVPARLVAARALQPLTGKQIHRFPDPPRVAEKGAGEERTVAESRQVPYLSRMRMALLQLRDHPELLDANRLDELTRSQIVAEQQIWQKIDHLAQQLKQQQARGVNYLPLNPRQPFYTFEWRKLQTVRKDLAEGALLEIFAGNDQHWSFVRDEPNWDPRFKVVVAPFFFDRGDLEGRSVESAKVELMPQVKNLAFAAAQRIPDRLAIPVQLSPVTFDASRTALVLDHPSSAEGDRNLAALMPVFEPAFDEPDQKPGIAFPKTVRDKALYQVKGFPDTTPIEGEAAEDLRGRSPETGLGERAVSTFRSGAGFLASYPVAIALDREIVFERIPLEPATVKAFTETEYLRTNYDRRAFEAQVVLNSLKVELATEYTYDGKTQPRGVIVGQVEGVRIVTRLGQEVAFIPASDLPESTLLPDNNPFTSEPGDAAESAGPRELAPAMIPLLIAKYQPEFFDSHIDQFVVARIQHELGFRTNPAQNPYGVDPALGEVFPGVRENNLPDATQRRELASPLKAWVERNHRLDDRFRLRFGNVSFKNSRDDKAPAPALLGGMVEGSPFGSAIHRAGIALWTATSQLRLNQPFNASSPPAPTEELAAWERALSIAPPEIHFSQRRFQFVVPDSRGERFLAGNQGSLGGRASSPVAGIPMARPATEPIIPVLRVDKEIWLPEDAALASPNQRLLLELTMMTTDVELLDQPPPHPWIEACFRYATPNSFHPELRDYRKTGDGGQYAVIHVALKSAQLVDSETGESVLPLLLKDYRTVGTAPDAAGKDSEPGKESQPPASKAAGRLPGEPPPGPESDPAVNAGTSQAMTARANASTAMLKPASGESPTSSGEPTGIHRQEGGFLSVVLAVLGLLALTGIGSLVIVMWWKRNGQPTAIASKGD
ncbi:MAG: DUF4852 domain-containing protein [Pirellulaceae bacterium]